MEKNWNKVALAVAAICTSKGNPKEPTEAKMLVDYDYKTYKITNEDFARAYLKDELKKTFDLSTYGGIIDSTKQLHYIYSHIKKGKNNKIFLIQSQLNHHLYFLRYKRSKGDSSIWYELDANASGLQIIAMGMNDLALATLVNLEGKEKCDIYILILSMFNESLNHVEAKYKSYNERYKLNLNNIDDEALVKLAEATNKDNNLSLRDLILAAFINESLRDTAKIIANIYMKISTKRQKSESIGPAQKGRWLIDPVMLELIELALKEDYNIELKKDSDFQETIHVILILKGYLDYIKLVNANPFIIKYNLLDQRSLMKKSIMSYPYGAGSSTREEEYIDYFIEEAHKAGISKYNYTALSQLAIKLNNLFVQFQRTKLRACARYLVISKLIVHVDYKPKDASTNKEDTVEDKNTNKSFERNVPFIMNTKWAYTEYVIFETQMKRVATAAITEKLSHRITLHLKSDHIAGKQFRRALNAIFTHNCDAEVLKNFLVIIKQINYLLAPLNIKITTYENHDNFAINITYAIFLKPILFEAYRRFYKSGYFLQYINSIPDTKKLAREKLRAAINSKSPLLKINNPNFVVVLGFSHLFYCVFSPYL